MPKLFLNKDNILSISELEAGTLSGDKLIKYDVKTERYVAVDNTTPGHMAILERRARFREDRERNPAPPPAAGSPRTWTGIR